MTTIFTPERIKEYVRNNKRHYYYKDTCKLYKDLNDHYINTVDMEVINAKRPNEGDKVKDYRKAIAVPVTKRYLTKIITYLSGIRKAKDWNIDYGTKPPPSNIIEKETVKEYLEKNIPIYESITNWMFSQLLTQYVIDANAIVLTMPNVTSVTPKNEFTRPYPVIYNSDQVVDYQAGNYYVLESKDIIYYKQGDRDIAGKAFYTVTTTEITRWDQSDQEGNFIQAYVLPNKLNRLPVHHLFGVITGDNGYNLLAESQFTPMVPYLKEAMRYYSDLQAERTLHIYSTVVLRAAQACITCKGTGQRPKRQNGEVINIECTKCGGKGSIMPNPFEPIIVQPNADGTFPDMDAMKYVTKDVKYADHLKIAFDDAGYCALSAVNFQNVDAVPLNQSGTAKEVDRDQQNVTMHTVAEDLVRITDKVAMDVVDWRYMDAVPNEDIRYEMLPQISVPDRFDLASTTQQLTDIQGMANSNMDANIQAAMQVDFVDKYFASNKPVADRIKLIMELNPFAGKTVEEVGYLKTLNGINEEDFVVFTYLNLLIDMAIEKDKKFYDKPKMEKITKLRELAKELIPEPVEPAQELDEQGNPIPANQPADTTANVAA